MARRIVVVQHPDLLGKNAGLRFGLKHKFLMDDSLPIKIANQHAFDLRFTHSGFFCLSEDGVCHS